MIRRSFRFTIAHLSGVVALACLSLFGFSAAAQQPATSAPTAQAAPAQAAPAPPPAPAPELKFPKTDPANFTASTPTKEEVNAFLEANWGFDDTRAWEVYAIEKTPVAGISKVVVLAGLKNSGQQLTPIQFYVLPDGKHMFAGNEIVPFGVHPFADARAELEARADGPYRGSASKNLEIVEFADFQCPHCKEAQPNMEKLATDFPHARIVYQSFPLPQHPEAINAADYGVCVAKLGGSSAFFTFDAAVYDGQAGLETPDGATMTLNSAVTKAGLDPVKVAACTKLPETREAVESSVKLAKDLGVMQTPTLMVNGRPLPANAPYETLKKIIEYQAKVDSAGQ